MVGFILKSPTFVLTNQFEFFLYWKHLRRRKFSIYSQFNLGETTEIYFFWWGAWVHTEISDFSIQSHFCLGEPVEVLKNKKYIKNLIRNIRDIGVLCRFAKTVVLRLLFSPFAVFMGCCKTIERYVFFFSFRVSCIRSTWKQRATWLKCALWEGTQELFVYFLQRNFDMGTQSYTNKAWQPLTDFRGPGRRRGRGEVNRQTLPHQSLQPGEAQEAKPIHCRARIQACHSADRDERGPTRRGLHR